MFRLDYHIGYFVPWAGIQPDLLVAASRVKNPEIDLATNIDQ
jgi:hypothetical protein